MWALLQKKGEGEDKKGRVGWLPEKRLIEPRSRSSPTCPNQTAQANLDMPSGRVSGACALRRQDRFGDQQAGARVLVDLR